MSLKSTIRLLNAYKPSSLKEIKELGLRLRKISNDESLYRDVYKVVGIPMVLKIPHQEGTYNECPVSDAEARTHAFNECKAILRINQYKKYESLRKFMPKLYYFDQKNGIIALHFYQPFNFPEEAKRVIARLVKGFVDAICPLDDNDVHYDNIAVGDKYYNPVIIDLGYFKQEKE